jgi:hydrogenase/urease accessory protein HupE
MKRPAIRAALAIGLPILPAAAQAHLVTSGLGPFYDGALHLLLSPADLLGLLAVALLAGLRGRQAARWTVVALPLSWLCAGLIGMQLTFVPDLAWVGIVSFMLLGGLVAADARLPSFSIALIGGIYGALQGLSSGAALVAAGAGFTSLGGVVLTVLLLALLISAAVAPLQVFWARVAVRVAGSWVVAVGMLMLGWMVQGLA